MKKHHLAYVLVLFTTTACVDVNVLPDGEEQDPVDVLGDDLPAFDSFSYVRQCTDTGVPFVEIIGALSSDVSPAALDCGEVMMASTGDDQLVLRLDPFPLQSGVQLISEDFILATELCGAGGCATLQETTIVVDQDGPMRRLDMIVSVDDRDFAVRSEWFPVCGGDWVPDCWFQGT